MTGNSMGLKLFPKRLQRWFTHHKLIFITDGKGKVIIEGTKYLIKEGALFYLSPGLYAMCCRSHTRLIN
jgi:glyoxylate utilization-related uncharacterized protein